MNYTPDDIIEYIFSEKLDQDFLIALAGNRGGYSIGEIPDAEVRLTEDGARLASKVFKLSVPIDDAEILAAAKQGMVISAFMERAGDSFQLHFLLHPFRTAEKAEHEDAIVKRVIRYMIARTVIAFRLDTPEKVLSYIGRK